MMKKIVLLLLGILLFTACLDIEDDTPSFALEFLPIDEYEVPEQFTPNQIDTIRIKYTLPNGCYSFDQLFYQTKDSIREIAVTAAVLLNELCTEEARQEDFEFAIRVAENDDDYILRFFKGIDDNGETIFEEVIVPVN